MRRQHLDTMTFVVFPKCIILKRENSTWRNFHDTLGEISVSVSGNIPTLKPMNWEEAWLLIADEQLWVWEITSWRSRLQEELPSILEECMEYTPNPIKKNQMISTCDWLELVTLGSWPIMPQNLPNMAKNHAKIQHYIMHMVI